MTDKCKASGFVNCDDCPFERFSECTDVAQISRDSEAKGLKDAAKIVQDAIGKLWSEGDNKKHDASVGAYQKILARAEEVERHD